LQKLFELDVLRGRMAEAEEVMARAGVSRQDAAQFLLDHARAEVSRGTGGELPYLQAIVALDPANEIGSVALVRALVRRGKMEEARAVLERAARAGVDPLLVDAHRAWIAAREGKLDEARSWLAKVPPDRWKNDSRLSATLTMIRASAPSLAPP
jgi:pentatricopeptide repeat protein